MLTFSIKRSLHFYQNNLDFLIFCGFEALAADRAGCSWAAAKMTDILLEGVAILDVVVRKCAVIFKCSAGMTEVHMMEGNSFSFLDHDFYILNGFSCLNPKKYGSAVEADIDLYFTRNQAKKIEGGVFLDVVV